jgi:hypothetical protein
MHCEGTTRLDGHGLDEVKANVGIDSICLAKAATICSMSPAFTIGVLCRR